MFRILIVSFHIVGFRQLYENEQLFDVTLCVGGKEFRGHKSLLAASSDYFRAMFTTELAEKDKNVCHEFVSYS